MSNTTLDTWDFRSRRLEENIGGSDFVGSESVLLLATPVAKYSSNALDTATAVGLTQDIQFNQQRQATQIHEVGSRRKYTFSSGRTQGQLTLSRVLFDGSSLMKTITPDRNLSLVNDTSVGSSPVEDAMDRAGFGNFYINLGASLFSHPIGLAMVFRDIGNQDIGACFFQEAYIVSHAMSVSSNQPFIGENCSILFEGIFPMQHRAGVQPNVNPTFPNDLGGTGQEPLIA